MVIYMQVDRGEWLALQRKVRELTKENEALKKTNDTLTKKLAVEKTAETKKKGDNK